MQLVLYLEVQLLVQPVHKDINLVDLLLAILIVVMAISCPVRVVTTVIMLLAMAVLLLV